MIKKHLRKYKDDFEDCKNSMKSVRTWYKLIPNLLTISRPIGMIPANILFFTGNVIPAIVLTALLLLTDLFDGKLARKWNVQSKLGADLDAVGDKIMFLGMSLPLIVANPLMIINLILEGVIALINVFGRIKELDTKTVYSGKIKMWFLSLTLGMGYLTKIFNMPISILKVLIGSTALSQLVAIKDYITEYRKMDFDKKLNMKLDECKDDEVLVDDDGMSRENLIEELRKERQFYLGFAEPNKVYTGKKKNRILMQEKRTIS